jgi:hypothetical protein
MTLLFQEYKTVSAMKNADLEMLQKTIGRSKATVLFNYFQEK